MAAEVSKVYLANGAHNNVRWNQETEVGKVLAVVVGRIAGSEIDVAHFALRLLHIPRGAAAPPSQIFWLHRHLKMGEISGRYMGPHPESEWRLELRVRYLPADLKEMAATQKATFHYFYDQIQRDYMQQVAWKVDKEVALELGCVEIRRFFQDMAPSALDKKANLDFLETEIGLTRFFPDHLIADYKSKALRKAIQGQFKRLASLSENECMFKFLDTLAKIARYDVEIFKCSLGAGWRVPVEVVVGPSLGIAYVADDRSSPKRLAELKHVVDIETEAGEAGKATVSFRVSAAPEPLVMTCPSLAIAESLADLVDGYQILMTQGGASVWSKREYLPDERGAPMSEEQPTHSDSHDEESLSSDIEADYSAPVTSGMEVDRAKLLGEGQFGDVYRALYAPDAAAPPVHIAVKACKLEQEEAHGASFLEEAGIMRQFSHPHIIRLLGVCLDSPIWILMELAPLGELREFLLKEGQSLAVPTLLLYAHQLSSALSYLESKSFVHRDIAARNVLVARRDLVKLSDFGLSRWLDGDSYYTSSRGKLPIKWMSVESINFRRFTPASDVWMFGVCIWEIMMLGVKPFQGVRNGQVIHKLEAGESEIMLTERDSPDVSKALDGIRKLSWGSEDLQKVKTPAPSTPPPPSPVHLAATLARQRRETADDAAWLEESASSMAPLAVPPPLLPMASPLYDPVPDTPPPGPRPDESVGIPLFPPKVPDGMVVDRRDDRIYDQVIAVVKAVSNFSKCLSGLEPSEFVSHVKGIGAELRELLRESEAEGARLSPPMATRLKLSEKVLSSDMHKLVEAMKRALQYSATTLDTEYRKSMLSEAHVLAVDCKAYLETADAARHLVKRLPFVSSVPKPASNATSSTPSPPNQSSPSPPNAHSPPTSTKL